MRICYLLLLCMTLIPFAAVGQNKIATVDSLRNAISRVMAEEQIVGATVGIIENDSVVFAEGFGFADLKNQVRVSNQTLFRLGSVTKMFVALGIMKLVSEGKLSLDSNVADLAPEIRFVNPFESTHSLKVIHLLEHTSGFDDIKLNRMYSYDKTKNDGLAMMQVHEPSMVCRWKPGERTAYSNPNYAALGFIIEKITGKRYDLYLREILLDPLRMRSTNFELGRESNLATKEYFKQTEVQSVYLKSGPQGAMWSNNIDMLSFIRFLIHDAEPLLSSEQFQRYETPESSLAAANGLKAGYAKGNSSAFPFAKSPDWRGHDGITGTCYTDCYYNKTLRSGFIVSTNSNQSPYAISQLILAYLERENENQPGESSSNPDDLRFFEGYYEFKSPRNQIAGFYETFLNTQHIFVSENTLWMKPVFGPAGKLVRVSKTEFKWEGMNKPLIIFLESEGRRSMCIGGTYYGEKSKGSVFVNRCIVFSVGLLAMSSVIFGLVMVIAFRKRKIRIKILLWRWLPALALVGLVVTCKQLFHIRDASYLLADLSSVTARSLTIAGGTIWFAVLTTVSFCYAVMNLRQKRSFADWYYLSITAALLIIVLYLSTQGWIPMITWLQ